MTSSSLPGVNDRNLSTLQPCVNHVLVIFPQVISYLLAEAKRDFSASDTDLKHVVGLDVKYGFTSSLTLDVTINTDFAQVEVDDEQLNLSRFPLFFPEKCSFFLEKAGTFAFGTRREMDLFFSRRIGIEEGWKVPIQAGARLTGKVDRFRVLEFRAESIFRDVFGERVLTWSRCKNDGELVEQVPEYPFSPGPQKSL